VETGVVVGIGGPLPGATVVGVVVLPPGPVAPGMVVPGPEVDVAGTGLEVSVLVG
jgi:hypothetical protein